MPASIGGLAVQRYGYLENEASQSAIAFGATGVSPGATGADNVLAVLTIPALQFERAFRRLRFTALGLYAVSANNKQVKIIFGPATAVVGSTVGTGGTTIADSGTVVTSDGGFVVEAIVAKFGARGSNTQMGQVILNVAKGVHATALTKPVFPVIDESKDILVAVTGNAGTTVTDIVLNYFGIEGLH